MIKFKYSLIIFICLSSIILSTEEINRQADESSTTAIPSKTLQQKRTMPDDGIEFRCSEEEIKACHYWPKTETTNNAFAYLDDELYENIIESDTKLPDEQTEYLGYITDNQEQTIYLYGTKNETSLDEENETENEDDE